jgi:hypothetical protein
MKAVKRKMKQLRSWSKLFEIAIKSGSESGKTYLVS